MVAIVASYGFDGLYSLRGYPSFNTADKKLTSADLVVVDRDLSQAEADELLKARVVLTMVGGEVVREG